MMLSALLLAPFASQAKEGVYFDGRFDGRCRFGYKPVSKHKIKDIYIRLERNVEDDEVQQFEGKVKVQEVEIDGRNAFQGQVDTLKFTIYGDSLDEPRHGVDFEYKSRYQRLRRKIECH